MQRIDEHCARSSCARQLYSLLHSLDGAEHRELERWPETIGLGSGAKVTEAFDAHFVVVDLADRGDVPHAEFRSRFEYRFESADVRRLGKAQELKVENVQVGGGEALFESSPRQRPRNDVRSRRWVSITGT